MKLLAELRRRHVFRMGGLYLVGAWLVVQVAATLLPVFDAPAWVMKAVVALIAIGFFAALVFAWIFELTPDGLERDAQSPAAGSPAPRTARRMDRGIIVVLMLALGYFALDKFVLSRPAAIAETATTTVNPPAAPEKSIAVMAFSDLSAGGDQAYFSDGMAEAVLSALSQVKGLRVAGRSSSFYFKGRNVDAREIGRTLGVAHILEGSVRKQEQRVRISAQLVRASDGLQLWSKTFDGDLTDVFELQDQIARAITDQLQVVLEGGAPARLVPVATTSTDAYELYLQATSVFDRRDFARFPEATAALRKAIALDPKFARAWSRIAAIEAIWSSYVYQDIERSHERVMEAANAALALDPTLAEPWAAIGVSYSKLRRGWLQQREALDRAIALDPDDAIANLWAGLRSCMTGYTRRCAQMIDHALARDPRMPNVVRWRGILYLRAGDTARAQEYLDRARADGLMIADRELADMAYARGDRDTAKRLWPNGASGVLQTLPPGSAEVLVAGMYDDDPAARERAVALLDRFLATPNARLNGGILLVLVKLGAPARALQLAREQSLDLTDFYSLLWSADGAPIRRLPEFPAFLRELGFHELWDKYGAPDLCRKVDAGGWQCD